MRARNWQEELQVELQVEVQVEVHGASWAEPAVTSSCSWHESMCAAMTMWPSQVTLPRTRGMCRSNRAHH